MISESTGPKTGTRARKMHNFERFMENVNLSKQEIYRRSFDEKQNGGKIKKDSTVVRNLERIFGAVLKISNQKGFKAMSMRDLSRESGLSMGALYNYFSGKDDLLEMLQHQQRQMSATILERSVAEALDPLEKLRSMVVTHLYLSEAMQPWFFFSYMETKNLIGEEREKAIESERATEKMICDILTEGQQQGVFADQDPLLSASLIKAMLQDWYLKRGKYAERKITVERYAEFVMEWIEAFVVKAEVRN
ncbi:TetR/AcrR family transcriptional regulator [Desulfatirhabdium butyrativorans]|uniref:TetR/AcrR family transcriptional regulator n=1 Tax=Desulfatirhabdium butyrativorans TaxID=340467 RepID=UPI0004249B7F|nr:TetR/AcrR family transcriptional regulator [Desulfatirhabdium butyrativorans]